MKKLYSSLSECDYHITDETDQTIKFTYKEVKGQLTQTKEGLKLHHVFDVYHKGQLIKAAYHYKHKKKISSDIEEFSKGGHLPPGPC